MIITITGTPGAGKTYIAKKLAKGNKNLKYLDLNTIIKKEKLYDRYDRIAKTYDVDEKKLKKLDRRYEEYREKDIKIKKIITLKELKQKINGKECIIIDSHLSHYLKSDLCIVVKADIKTISKRLKKRGYSEKKIKNNIESEIFDICLEDAKKLERNIFIINNG